MTKALDTIDQLYQYQPKVPPLKRIPKSPYKQEEQLLLQSLNDLHLAQDPQHLYQMLNQQQMEKNQKKKKKKKNLYNLHHQKD